MPSNNDKRQQNTRRAPSFSVQDEIKRNRRMRQTGRIRKARTKARALFTFLLCLAIFVLATAAILLAVMRVRTVSVSGNSRYSSEEILEAADANGSILPFLGEDAVEKKIVAVCPYVNDIKLVKVYPSAVEIVVHEAEAIFAVDVRGEFFSLDKDLRVIDRVPNESGLIKLSLAEIRSAVEGSQIEFYDVESRELIDKMLSSFVHSDVELPFTSIDLSDRFNLVAMVGENVKIEFGDYNYINEKLKLAQRILDTPEATTSQRSLIDVSVPSKPSALFDYDGEF